MTATTPLYANNVEVDIEWTYINGITTVKMRINNLKISQWAAMGLSLDDSMVLTLSKFYSIKKKNLIFYF